MRRSKANVFHDIYNQPYDNNTRVKLYNSSKSSVQMIQRMSLLKRLKVHFGCVNSICWNDTGNLILSGSDDQRLVLTNAYNYQVLQDYKTSHRANIFSAKFLPNNGDHRIVSCSGDGIILYTDLMRKSETFHNQFTCHSGTTYEIATIPCEPHTFLSCGEDGTVRWFDLRFKEKCNTSRCVEDVLLFCQRAVTAISVNPVMPNQIAIGLSNSNVRTFDRRMLGTTATAKALYSFTVPEFEGSSYRITSLSYSPDGQDILVSYSSDHLYLFGTKDQGSTQLRKEIGGKGKGKRYPLRSPQPVRRLRLRGDWSDTGPDARPEREGGRRNGTEIAQARPVLHTSLMQRMTDVLSRMLNDPATRAALSGGGEDSLEGVMDQQAENNQQNNDNSTDAAEDRNNNVIDERQQQAVNESSNSLEIDTSGVENTENDQAVASVSMDQINESVDDTSSPSEIEHVNERLDGEPQIPMETESSHSEERKSPEQSSTTHNVSLSESTGERSSLETEASNVQNSDNSSTMMENLQDRLTTMRDGFLERHGSEPALKLIYSDKSTTSATISLGVADEVTRDGYHAGASAGHSSSNFSDPGPSNSHSKPTYNTTREATDEDVYNDSDDEDEDSDRRMVNPIETEMDEAIENARHRAAEGFEKSEDAHLPDMHVKQKYMGHRNARTMIKEANFWGDDFVMSGSDCGHVFVWERDTAKLCMLLEADQHVVNCVQPHPFLPMLATSGIDYDVKLWAPTNEESTFDEKFAEDLKKRNAVMLEETKDTITVPAVFMIRMLACLNQIRRGRGRNRRRSGDDD